MDKDINAAGEKAVVGTDSPPMESFEGSRRRKSSVVNADVLGGEIFDTRYESTQRGLKSRLVSLKLNNRLQALMYAVQTCPNDCARWNYRHRFVRWFGTNVGTRWTSIYSRMLHVDVAFNLLRCHRNYRSRSIFANTWKVPYKMIVTLHSRSLTSVAL
jgi:hypothetical protein